MAKDRKQKYTEDLNELWGRSQTKRAKYRRNLRQYLHTFGFSMTNLDDTSVAGYYSNSSYDREEDTSSGIQENVVKSTIDTLVAIMAAQKVRPFFNTVNGTFKDIKLVKAAQQFFDDLFDEQNLHRTITQCFRDACIFDTGVIFIDPVTKTVSRIMPWQISFDQREASYNNLTRCVLKQENFPITLLPFPELKKQLKGRPISSDVTYFKYWNLNDGVLVHYIPELDFYKEESWVSPVLPFIFMNYEIPIKSASSSSIVDILWGIQEAIDAILVKIKDASQLASPLKFFVPEQSTIKASKINNRVGEVITYTALPNQTSAPIVTATEPFMDPQWLQLLDKFKQDAYELVGVSQLSAAMQKPKGLNSGVAISTYEDIELGRMEVQADMIVRIYTDIAKLCIALFPAEDPILPPNRWREDITWADIVAAQDQMIVQFSSAENLSKDPQTRAQQVLMLVQMGVIPQTRVAALMEIPDAVQGYSLANNAIDAVMKVIDNCLSNGDMDVPDYVDQETLLNEILNTQLSLYAAKGNGNQEDIDKLQQLYEVVASQQMNQMSNAEMSASQALMNEVQQDLANPQGQINTAMNQALNAPGDEDDMDMPDASAAPGL